MHKDSHVHIGWFKEKYYDFEPVFEAVFTSGKINEIAYSSTTSCVKDVKYNIIVKEIEAVQKKYSSVAIPLFWFVPDYINQEVKINVTMRELKYGGFKLHPLGNNWNFEKDTRQMKVLHEIFDYADKNKYPILIHTGENGVDRPNRFERFFGEYKNARIILAHCRPADETIEMMIKYGNVFCDTSFATPKRIEQIKNAGFTERIIFGTDFPITHFYYGAKKGISLEEQYLEDVKDL